MIDQSNYTRPDWDIYFLDLADAVSTRATCDRGRAGCVITKDKRIIATGYVGSPPGLPHCDDVGHDLRRVMEEDGTVRQHCVRTIHAEQNAICQAAKYGVSLDGGTLYCKLVPCRVCAMLVISAGIARVVARKNYHVSEDSIRMFKEAGIELIVHDDSVEVYENQ